ncbi:phospholipase [Pseudoduganella flava]|uniref:Phospholipase n=1 Tax=Pseudoduganella flava TaxID=871742 RepID=A0ABX6G0M6_9BURK|nr:phospholipase [Pseudoduganella flava]
MYKAKKSVDIITWGFDPGMVLVRNGSAQKGQRFGDLLRNVASRKKNPITVRILVWHDNPLSQKMMKNVPGLYGEHFPAVGCGASGYYSSAHQRYNARWFEAVAAGEIPNIDFRVRSLSIVHLNACLKNEPSVPWNANARIAAMYATHHQKMMLIDYEMPEVARGYVMGHNCVTDFWDTADHPFQSPLRERFFREEPAGLAKRYKSPEPMDFQGSGIYSPGYRLATTGAEERREALARHLDRISFVAKPYQDVSCRVRGPILADMNHNFCQAWQASDQIRSMTRELFMLALAPVRVPLRHGMRQVFPPDYDSAMVKRRAEIPWQAYVLGNGKHSAQLLRTQPEHGEKSIKECYANLTRQMRHYIFIQNQYVQYEPWAEHLKQCVQQMRSAGYSKDVYVFILTSTPERDGMDLHTYEVASGIGQSERMKVEHADAVEKARMGKAKMPISPQQMKAHGIHVVMGSLWTCAAKNEQWPLLPEEYEEIYIHAKVAIVDDVAFTIGSANLNLRSMAIDSELNLLSNAQDVAFAVRGELFNQCSTTTGPAQYGDMKKTLEAWAQQMSRNFESRSMGAALGSQIMTFYVDRKPGSPVV